MIEEVKIGWGLVMCISQGILEVEVEVVVLHCFWVEKMFVEGRNGSGEGL